MKLKMQKPNFRACIFFVGGRFFFPTVENGFNVGDEERFGDGESEDLLKNVTKGRMAAIFIVASPPDDVD